MNAYDRTHLRDEVLLQSVEEHATDERGATARLLADIAEIDIRRLFAPAGYSSMHAFCVERLKLSDDSAWKRLQVARPARRFPQMYLALAEGRVHLSGLVLLAPHVTAENVDDLLAACTGLRKREIESLVARGFPQVEALRLDEGISALPVAALAQPVEGPAEPAPNCQSSAPGQTNGKSAPARIRPIGPDRFSFEIAVDQETHDLLRRAQELLGRPDVASVLRRALESLVTRLEKKKAAFTDKPRQPRAMRSARTIPAHVRRAVWDRDGGQCTYIGDDDHRCGSRWRIEFDHVVPIALGGESTAENLRLLCGTHNQLEAERVLGREFMEARRS